MSFLLDTNVVSEWTKPRPDPGVVTWLQEADEDRVYLSVISLAEMRYGIERLPVGARRSRLELWFTEELLVRFEGRILPVDPLVAETWGQVTARSLAEGRSMSAMDGFLAATAVVHKLTMVTRNVSDFASLGHPLINPWLLAGV